MDKRQKQNHIFVKDSGVEALDGRTDSLSLLLDLKVLIKEYYTATFTVDERGLVIGFNNGQKFKITVDEIK